MTTLVWFRRDLRLIDNPALSAAYESDDPIIPVFVYSPEEEQPWEPGSASRWYLHHSLIALDEDLSAHGMQLITRSGSSIDRLKALAREFGATRIYWNRLYEPTVIKRDQAVVKALQKAGLEVDVFHDHSLLPPGEIRNSSDQHYRVFTPYWRRLATVLAESTADRGIHSVPVRRRQAVSVLPRPNGSAFPRRESLPAPDGSCNGEPLHRILPRY